MTCFSWPVSMQDADRGLKGASMAWVDSCTSAMKGPGLLATFSKDNKEVNQQAGAKSPAWNPAQPGPAEPQLAHKHRNEKYDVEFWACLLSSTIAAIAA